MSQQLGTGETVVDSSSQSNQPDYDSVEIPAKAPSEYTYRERRAELLQLVRQAGHPRSLNQGELADRYGVSQQQVSKDFDRISKHVDETLGSRRALISEAVYHRAIQGLLEDDDYKAAAKVTSDWNAWIEEYQDLKELDARIARLEQAQEDER